MDVVSDNVTYIYDTVATKIISYQKYLLCLSRYFRSGVKQKCIKWALNVSWQQITGRTNMIFSTRAYFTSCSVGVSIFVALKPPDLRKDNNSVYFNILASTVTAFIFLAFELENSSDQLACIPSLENFICKTHH